jgi:hypothetical protein
MSGPGLGDRWLAGDRIPGVAFALNERVEIAEGRFGGRAGTVLLLMAVAPEPRYLIGLGADGGDVRIRQSQLRALESRA